MLIFRGALLFFLCCATVFSPFTPVYATDEQTTHRKLEQINIQLHTLDNLLQQFNNDRSKAQQHLQRIEVTISDLNKKIIAIEQALQNDQKTLSEQHSKRQALLYRKQQQQQSIEQYMLGAYQIRKQSKLKLLLNQENPKTLSRALAYYDYFNRAHNQKLTNHKSTLKAIDQTQAQIIVNTQSLSNNKQLLKKQYQALAEEQRTRQQQLEAINTTIKNNEQQRGQLVKESAELAAILDVIKQTTPQSTALLGNQAFSARKGQLSWPVELTAWGRKPSNHFGSRRHNSDLRWQGLLLPAQEGSIVHSIHHGHVVFADWLQGFGLLIIVDHGDDYMSLYAHNQSLLRNTGDWVNSEDPIATVGNSGGQDKASLYFEIRHRGQPVNPTNWCKDI